MKYKVLWNYKSSLGGPWIKGTEIDVEPSLAEAVNRDSPGVLKAVKEKAATDASTGSGSDRMVKGAETRQGELEIQEGENPQKTVKGNPEMDDRGKEEPITKETFKAVKG